MAATNKIWIPLTILGLAIIAVIVGTRNVALRNYVPSEKEVCKAKGDCYNWSSSDPSGRTGKCTKNTEGICGQIGGTISTIQTPTQRITITPLIFNGEPTKYNNINV